MSSSVLYVLGLPVSTNPTTTIKLLAHLSYFQESRFFFVRVYEGKSDPNTMLGRQLSVTSISGVVFYATTCYIWTSWAALPVVAEM
jgi:hypothetical protein